jgi:hypothetical protein
MEFVVMKLVGKSVKPNSIFGVLDKRNPGKLPRVAGTHWVDHETNDEGHAQFAAEAETAIATSGYFLMGAGGERPQLPLGTVPHIR